MTSHSSNGAGAGTSAEPVGELRFQVQIDGKAIGLFSECTGLQVEYDVFSVEEGGENRFAHKFRGRAKYQNLVLKRGITHEAALMAWFYACQEGLDRRSVTVSLLGADLDEVRSWTFANGFPVKWQGPQLKADSGNLATETLEIAHHGFAPAS